MKKVTVVFNTPVPDEVTKEFVSTFTRKAANVKECDSFAFKSGENFLVVMYHESEQTNFINIIKKFINLISETL